MSHDGAAFSRQSVLSPPLLASLDSQHTFGSYDGPSSSRLSLDASSTSHHPAETTPQPRRTRSRASSAASVHNLASTAGAATPCLNGNAQSHSNRKARKHHHVQSGHSRAGSRSGPIPMPTRSATSNACSFSSTSFEDQRPLLSTFRNRSTPHLDGLRSLSAAHEQPHRAAQSSTLTAPSSPLTTAAASFALAMSPVAQASTSADPLMPSDWTLDASAPTSPYTSLSRNASDYLDPALLAQLQSQNGSSHPELRANGRPDPSPPVDPVFGRLSPQQVHVSNQTRQSEWAQHAAHVQQTAHLLGLHRLLASRSTPHLPDLDSSYLGHEFESPPPYAPRASALETELERAADLNAGANGSHRLPQSGSTIHDGADPPLPPPISIPSSVGEHSAPGSTFASSQTRPSLRARSSSRGSRSGPPSPSASFYGRRGLTSLSPFPVGLEMTPSVAHVPHFSSTPASPGVAPDSDGDDDVDSMLSFSSTRSKQRRDERRQTIASTDIASRADVSNGSMPGSSAQAQAALSRRRRSGSAGSARQLLRPRTPIHSATTRDTADQPQRPVETSLHTSAEHPTASSRTLAGANGSDGSAPVATHGTGPPQRQSAAPASNHLARDEDADSGSIRVSPASDSTHPESPMSPAVTPDVPTSRTFTGSPKASAPQSMSDKLEIKPASAAAPQDEEEFSLVFKLLLHSLRILAAVPGCIGTFWLARNAWVLATQHGHLLSPGHVLVTADGTEQFWSAELSERPTLQGSSRFGRRQPGSLDFAVACLWSMSTAYHALSFTTLLLRRWLLYYSILPSLIRLVALQVICWPLVRITVHVFGADQPLGAWVVVGTTTALSDVVSRWVTSNIADAPLDDELDEEEAEEEEENEALEYLSDHRFVKSPVRATVAERLLHADQYPCSGAQPLVGDSDRDPRSGDESDAAAASFFASERERQRKQRRGGQGTRFWRAVIGGPSFAASSRRRKTNRSTNTSSTANGGLSYLSGVGTETEMEAESDWPGYATDHTVLGGGSGTPPSRFATQSNHEGLRRRLGAVNAETSPASPASTGQAMPSLRAGRSMFERRPVLPPFPFRPSTYRQGSTRYVYRDGAWTRERTGSRRNFHWDVAVWRNVVPIAVLSYLSMWMLILDAMRSGA